MDRRRVAFVVVIAVLAVVAGAGVVAIRDGGSGRWQDPGGETGGSGGATGDGPTDGDADAAPGGGAGDGTGPGTQAGAPGVGDPLFPDLGNGGYDVRRYTLDLTWSDGERLDGVATIEAVADTALSSFNLDLVGLEVGDATVDGDPARTTRRGDRELVVTPAEPIDAGVRFTTEISYGGHPEPIGSLLAGLGGWSSDGREVYVANQPDGAATFYPVNDHPSDKARYDIRVTAPADLTVVANGTLAGTSPAPGESSSPPDDREGTDPDTRTWHYEVADPMASYLVQIAIGNLTIDESTSPGGVPLRHAVDDDVPDGLDAMAETGEMLDHFADLFGPYPFEVYGGLVVDEDIGFALETQTLSLFPPHTTEVVVAHELAHQWFGDHVTPATWQDIWLSEGFATYAEWLWAEHDGRRTVDEQARAVGGDWLVDLDLPPADPGDPRNLFHDSVYVRGALTLHVLRDTIGDEDFFTLLRRWVERYGGRSASTADFEALAEEVSGQDLAELFDAWLRSDEVPPLGDWLG